MGLKLFIPGWQVRVWRWAHQAFGGLSGKTYLTTRERIYRFWEESAELGQALDMTREDWDKVGEYVFNRPKGERNQEFGGAAVTLLCLAAQQQVELEDCLREEVERVEQPEVMKKIREKQAMKAEHNL